MADDQSFFRPESIEASRNRTGGPVNNQGIASWILVIFIICTFACAVTFLSIARYSKKETVFGQILPADGVVRVTSARPGIVKAVSVISDQSVGAGDQLFLLSFDAVLEDGSHHAVKVNEITQEQIIFNEESFLAQERKILEGQRITSDRLMGLKTSLPLLIEQRALQAERVSILQKSYDAMSTLAEKQYVSQVQLAARKDSLLQAGQSLLQIDQNIAEQRNQIRQLEGELKSTQHDLSLVRTNQKNASAQLEERRLNTLSSQGGRINALKSGQITNLQVRLGDFIQANQTLALLVPEGSKNHLQVVLWVPSRAIGFVEKGNKVRLMFDAYPYQTFGVGHGKVSEISMAPIMPGELPIPLETQEQMYKVVVSLDKSTHQAYGRNWEFKAGMKLTADLILDEKSLLDWLLDPIIAVRKRAGH